MPKVPSSKRKKRKAKAQSVEAKEKSVEANEKGLEAKGKSVASANWLGIHKVCAFMCFHAKRILANEKTFSYLILTFRNPFLIGKRDKNCLHRLKSSCH